MIKQSYGIRTATGIKMMDVEAEPEVHEQLVVILRSLSSFRELYSELGGIQNQVTQTQGWLKAVIDKNGLSPLFNEELL